MRPFTSIRLFAFVLFALLVSAGAQAQTEHYDEVYDRNGEIREHYRGVVEPVLEMNKAEKKSFHERSYRAFKNDNALDAMPNVIPTGEKANILDPGVKQRAQAIIAFLRDHYSGRRTYRSIVTEDVIRKIIERSGELGYDGKIDPKELAFIYGPDLIRDPGGKWRVLEDNTGMVGGLGDLELARVFMERNRPGLSELFESPDPNKFYDDLAKGYKARAKERGGKAVLLMSPMITDNEDKRLVEIYRQRGIEVVFAKGGSLKLSIESDGVYTYDRQAGPVSKEKVGYLVLNGEHSWFDTTHSASFRRYVVEFAKEAAVDPDESASMRKKLAKLLTQPQTDWLIEELAAVVKAESIYLFDWKSSAPGLVEAILSGKVGANYTPGTEFVSDKEFYIYVEDFIRFYLKEEPIIKNVDTWTFVDREGRLKRDVLESVFANLRTSLVIKKFDGRGGDAVWVGPKMDEKFIPELRKMVEAQPGLFQAQKYTAPSVVLGKIVDKRLLADVYARDRRFSMTVANTFFGRGISKDGDGKVNLSSNGTESTVLIRKGASGLCRDLFLGPPRSSMVTR